MAEVLLFHHVQGLTDGVREFAERVGAGRHTVHAPDLYDGERADTIEAGFAIRKAIGGEQLEARTRRALAELPDGLVYGGISAGGAAAQELAQQRPGALGALLYESFVSLSADWAFGQWPDGLPVQVHGMDHDPFFALEGDLDAARELAAAVGPDVASVFVYPGDRHLFTDSSLPSYDADATALVVERSTEFLDRLA